MALLPKSYKNGTRIKVFKYNGVEVLNANYVKKSDGAKSCCYHKHLGESGKDYSNGCYTTKVKNGGYCRGYQKKHKWKGCTCGRSWPCAGDGSGGNDSYGHSYVEKEYYSTEYHSSESGCSEWTSYYRYDLGCGYDADDEN